MIVNSGDIRSFYSCHHRLSLDSKSSDYLAKRYQKITRVLAKLDSEIIPKCADKIKGSEVRKRIYSLQAEYFSALCNRCMGVVFNSGRKVKNGAVTVSDIVSYGEETLLKCLEKWQPERKITFITYFTTAVFKLFYTLIRKKHFRDWHRHMWSLDALVDNEDYNFEPTETDQFTFGCKKPKRIRLDKKALNEELNKLIFNPGTVEALKVHLDINDDLYLHYVILSAKKRNSIINNNELETLSYLNSVYKEDDEQNFSKIYMCESEIDDHKDKQNKQKLKEEILCQE